MPWPTYHRSTWSAFFRSFSPVQVVGPLQPARPNLICSPPVVQTLPPHYRAFPELDIAQIDRYAHLRCDTYSKTWLPQVLPFTPASLPRLPPISQTALDRLWTEPALAEILSDAPEARTRDSWKAYDGVGDRLINAAALAAVNRAREQGINSPNASVLLQNTTLSYLAYSYRLHYGYRSVLNTTSPRQKAFADMFEAYIGAAHLENNVKGLESPVTAYLAELFHPSHWPNWATVSPAKTYLGKDLRAGRRNVAVPSPIDHPGSAALSAATSLAAVRSFRGLRDARDAKIPSVMTSLKRRRDLAKSPNRPKRSYVAFSVEMRPVPASAGRMPTPIKRRERPTRFIQPSSIATGVAADKTMDTGEQKTGIQLPARPLVVSRFRPIPPRPPRWTR